MPQLVSRTSSSYPLYLDIERSINEETKFGIEHFDEKNHHHHHHHHHQHRKSSKEQLIDFNFFYENLFSHANNFYSLNSPLLNESFNYCLNKVYQDKNGTANSEHHKSFSIDSILGFANKDFTKQQSAVNFSGTNSFDYWPQNYQQPEKISSKESYSCFNTIPANKLSASLNEEHVKLNPEPLKCSSVEKNIGLKMNNNKKGKKASKHIGLSENSNKMVNFGGTSKSKRVRTIFTPEQLERLETEFEKQQYMVGVGRLYLASTLNLTESQVKVWFQNRRIKWRKQHLENFQDNVDKDGNNNEDNNKSFD